MKVGFTAQVICSCQHSGCSG